MAANGLGSREQALMLDMVEALTSSLELAEVLPRVYGLLSRLLPADYAALCVSKPGRPSEYDWMVAQMPAAFFARYPEMAAEDFVRGAVVRRPNVVLRDSEMVPREVLEGSLLYRRCRELGMPLEHVMAVLLDVKSDWHGGLTLYRERRRPFSDKERALLQRLTPVLANTVRNCRLLGESVQRGRVLESLFQRQVGESLVLAPPGTEVMRTAGATALLERWFPPLERGRDGVPEVLRERLGRLVARGQVAGGWERGGPGGRLEVDFVPLPQEQGRRLWALVLREVPEATPLPAHWRERLTEREAQVVAGVLRGWDNQLVADALGCSLGTVKKHLQRVFDKLGVSSRAALLHLAARR